MGRNTVGGRSGDQRIRLVVLLVGTAFVTVVLPRIWPTRVTSERIPAPTLVEAYEEIPGVLEMLIPPCGCAYLPEGETKSVLNCCWNDGNGSCPECRSIGAAALRMTREGKSPEEIQRYIDNVSGFTLE